MNRACTAPGLSQTSQPLPSSDSNADTSYVRPLTRWADGACGLLAKIALRRNWSLIGGLIAIALSLICRGSTNLDFHQISKRIDARCLEWQCQHPLSPVSDFLSPLETYQAGDEHDRASHLYKIGFRLTIPLLSRALHLGFWGWIILPFVAGLIFYPLCCKVVFNLTGDRVFALLFAWAFAVTEAGHLFFGDFWLLYGDGVGLLLVLICMASRSPALIFTAAILASFCDERGLLALLPVYLFYSCKAGALREWRFSCLLRPNAQMWAIGAALLGYLILRLALRAIFHLEIDDSGLMQKATILSNLQEKFPGAIFVTFKFLWLLPILGAVGALSSGCRAWVLWATLSVAPLFLASMMVFDVTRSLSYAFPALLIGVKLMSSEDKVSNRRVMLFVFVFSVAWWDLYRSSYQWRTLFSAKDVKSPVIGLLCESARR